MKATAAESLPMPRREILLAAAASLFAGAAFAQGAPSGASPRPAARSAPVQLAFELISPSEAGREREARAKSGEAADMPEARTRSLPGASPLAAAPGGFAIRVLMPTPQAAVTAPLRIELLFDTPPGTRIVPSTFRVLYGVLKIDLTERLRRFATISERGVVVEQAMVPDGMHRLFLQVANDRGNVAEQELRLRVGAAS